MHPVRRRLALVFVLSLCVAPLAPAAGQRRPVRAARPAARAARTPITARKWADSVRVAIDAATRAGGMARLTAARRLATRAAAAYPDDALIRHYEGYVIYRLITVGGAALPEAEAAGYLDDARAALEQSLARRPMAESYLILSEIYGRQIAADRSRTASLVRATALARARAMAIGAKNPRVYLLAGIAALNTSTEAGGGTKAAEQLLDASVELFQRDRPRAPEPSWGRAEAYAWLGQVYERTGRRPAAARMYARALQLEPGNVWVRDVLLPGVRQAGRR